LNRDDIQKRTTPEENEYVVKPVDAFENPFAVSVAIQYFHDLADTPITGSQVATFFNAVLSQGRFWTDATDDANLPEFPGHLL